VLCSGKLPRNAAHVKNSGDRIHRPIRVDDRPNLPLAVRLRKLAIDGEKTLQGVAELVYQQSFQV
jgi:hypothetical protein